MFTQNAIIIMTLISPGGLSVLYELICFFETTFIGSCWKAISYKEIDLLYLKPI